MGFTKSGPIGLMARHPSRNALFLPDIYFSTTSASLHRRAPIGTFLIIVRGADNLSACLPTNSAATQYCDGLRGAFIVDDPVDRYDHLYDVDDGMQLEVLLQLRKAESPPRIYSHITCGLVFVHLLSCAMWLRLSIGIMCTPLTS
jgi:hypothetical protein